MYRALTEEQVLRLYPGKREIIKNLLSYPTGVVAIEVKRSLAKELVGQDFTVQCQDGDYVYTVLRGDGDDWHEFDVDTLTPIT